jgi:hypothetical protein
VLKVSRLYLIHDCFSCPAFHFGYGERRKIAAKNGCYFLAKDLLIVTFNAINFIEAFGNGPQTTNMDQWSHPLPVLVGVDLLGVLAMAWYVYFLRRKG